MTNTERAQALATQIADLALEDRQIALLSIALALEGVRAALGVSTSSASALITRLQAARRAA